MNLQTDRGTLRCCNQNFPCSLCSALVTHPLPLPFYPHRPHLLRLPTDPDLYAHKKLKTQLSSSHPDKFSTEELKLKRTRTGSLNENTLRIPHIEITADYTSYDGIFVNDVDVNFLCARPFLDPYTPESVDSHTPNVEGNSSGSIEDSIELSSELTDVLSDNLESKSFLKLKRDRSVSPTQLKSRLENLLSDETLKKVPELERLNSRDSCKSGASKQGGFCCLVLKCYGFCRRRAGKVDCNLCGSNSSHFSTS